MDKNFKYNTIKMNSIKDKVQQAMKIGSVQLNTGIIIAFKIRLSNRLQKISCRHLSFI